MQRAEDGEAKDGEARDGEARDGEARDGEARRQTARQTERHETETTRPRRDPARDTKPDNGRPRTPSRPSDRTQDTDHPSTASHKQASVILSFPPPAVVVPLVPRIIILILMRLRPRRLLPLSLSVGKRLRINPCRTVAITCASRLFCKTRLMMVSGGRVTRKCLTTLRTSCRRVRAAGVSRCFRCLTGRSPVSLGLCLAVIYE